MIEVKQLRKFYHHSRGLDGFSLQVGRGELVGLVGPNGAGKTTLIKILATLIRSDEGSAVVAGHDVIRDFRLVRASVGYLPDVAGIYQDMRIQEYLEFFADAFRLEGAERSRAIQLGLERSGLADRRTDFVEHLSLGWKQRLHLAKCLMHSPAVLLLDEPATGLDPLARISLREQLKHLREEGLTILIASHILTDLENICSRIVFIADGKNIREDAATPSPAAPQSTSVDCEIRYLGVRDVVTRALGGIPGAQILEASEGYCRISLPGTPRDASDLLRNLLVLGLTITSFDTRGLGLEAKYRRTFERKAP
ncbi:MAG TPA: ABC transporter ATP-binding protein [Candidatus Acidoferrum sp.]|nr:ABC transporter ATP-binding protein [Candidatus Acidoferrum sp.]